MTPSRAGQAVTVMLAVGLMGGLSVAICRAPAASLWRAHVVAGWPVVQGEIETADIVPTHTPRQGKRAAWDGWCVSWTYAYDWRETRLHGRLVDPTPSLYAPGCFAYPAGAQASAQRHPPGSALAVRVDPRQPLESTASPPESPAGDIVAIVFGLLPALVGLASIPDILRAKPRAGFGKRG